MIAGVADTHAAIWFLAGDPRLSTKAKDFFDHAAIARNKIVVSPVSLAEIIYLMEKKRLPLSAFDDLKAALDNPNHLLDEGPFTAEVVGWMRTVRREEVPDMPDRIVSATAEFLGVPLISCDARIRASNVQTVWWTRLPGTRRVLVLERAHSDLRRRLRFLPHLDRFLAHSDRQHG